MAVKLTSQAADNACVTWLSAGYYCIVINNAYTLKILGVLKVKKCRGHSPSGLYSCCGTVCSCASVHICVCCVHVCVRVRMFVLCCLCAVFMCVSVLVCVFVCMSCITYL